MAYLYAAQRMMALSPNGSVLGMAVQHTAVVMQLCYSTMLFFISE